MSLTSSSREDIEQFVREETTQPPFFPPFASSSKPTLARLRYRAIYITDTSKPAWMDAQGAWRYADGSPV